MKRKLLFVLFGFYIGCSGLSAQQDPVFLSLTRKVTPQADLPTNISVITAEQIQASNKTDVAQILKDEADISISAIGAKGAAESVSLRGSSASQVLVLVNGIKINDPALGSADLSRISVDDIERIEIIKGGASSIYGTSALGGVINIITKKAGATDKQASLDVSGASYNTQNYKIGFNSYLENVSCLFRASKDYSDGYRENSSYDANNFFTNIAVENTVLGSFSLSFEYYKTNMGTPGLGVSLDEYDGVAEIAASDPAARQSDNSGYIRLENEYKASGNTIKTSLFTSNGNIKSSNPTRTIWGFASPLDEETQNLSFGGELQWLGQSGLTLGASWEQNIYGLIDHIIEAKMIDRARLVSSLYAQDNIKLNRFDIIPSARYDSNSDFGDVFSPHLTVVYRENNNIKLSGNIGKSWRAPTYNDLYYPNSGNSNLQPEEALTSDLGIEYKTPGVDTSLTIFNTETTNLIDWADIGGGVWAPSNIGKSIQQGAELSYKQALMKQLPQTFTYTYLWTEDTINKEVLPYKPCNRINYHLSYIINDNYTIGTQLGYVSSQETNDYEIPPVVQLPEYLTADIYASRKVSDFEIWLRLENITDERYQTRLRYPLPGRTFAAGVKLKFKG